MYTCVNISLCCCNSLLLCSSAIASFTSSCLRSAILWLSSSSSYTHTQYITMLQDLRTTNTAMYYCVWLYVPWLGCSPSQRSGCATDYCGPVDATLLSAPVTTQFVIHSPVPLNLVSYQQPIMNNIYTLVNMCITLPWALVCILCMGLCYSVKWALCMVIGLTSLMCLLLLLMDCCLVCSSFNINSISSSNSCTRSNNSSRWRTAC